MTTDHDNLSAQIADQLSDLEREGSVGDVAFLSRAREALEQVLQSSGGNEVAVRATLAELREGGNLRQETYELVTTMLDRYSTEHLATAEGEEAPDDDSADPAFDETMVIDTRAMNIEQRRAEQQLQVGSVLRDRYLLKKQVSGGSMGVVFQALDRRLAESGEKEPFVAIKVLAVELSEDPKALRLLQQEAAKGRFLTHNNIVRFIDFDRDDELYFIIMEWLDGENLADILDRSVKLDVETALQITRQIGEALDYAHDRGIVHADIKPANIMILPDGNAKLFDFGVARVRHQQGDSPAATEPGLPGALTPAYSSMQVLTGEEPVPEDDVFSLACLLYRLVAGYRVFGPRNAAEAAEEGMTPQQLQGLTDKQWRAAKKALAFSRVTRYSRVSDFLKELEDDTAPAPAPTLSPTIEAEAPPAQDPVEIVVDATGRFSAEPESSSWWPIFGSILAIGLAAAWFLYPYYEDQLGDFLADLTQTPAAEEAAPIPEPEIPVAEEPVAEIETEATEETPVASVPQAEPETVVDTGPVEELAPEPAPEPEIVPEPVVLPDGDAAVTLDGSEITIELVEDDASLTLDVIQPVPADFERALTVVEQSFSGNRSPLESGELTLDTQDVVFAPGVERQQVVVGMTSDPVREADQQSVLAIEDGNGNVLAQVTVELRDDDQRRFETALPVDTVAFATGQTSVMEQEAAVQIDVVRYKPSNTTLSVAYTVSDVTATADEDYFAPRDSFVFFEAGQRSARILIPLVQDSDVEGNEAFVLELQSSNTLTDSDVYQRIAVFIRDDD